MNNRESDAKDISDIFLRIGDKNCQVVVVIGSGCIPTKTKVPNAPELQRKFPAYTGRKGALKFDTEPKKWWANFWIPKVINQLDVEEPQPFGVKCLSYLCQKFPTNFWVVSEAMDLELLLPVRSVTNLHTTSITQFSCYSDTCSKRSSSFSLEEQRLGLPMCKSCSTPMLPSFARHALCLGNEKEIENISHEAIDWVQHADILFPMCQNITDGIVTVLEKTVFNKSYRGIVPIVSTKGLFDSVVSMENSDKRQFLERELLELSSSKSKLRDLPGNSEQVLGIIAQTCAYLIPANNNPPALPRPFSKVTDYIPSDSEEQTVQYHNLALERTTIDNKKRKSRLEQKSKGTRGRKTKRKSQKKKTVEANSKVLEHGRLQGLFQAIESIIGDESPEVEQGDKSRTVQPSKRSRTMRHSTRRGKTTNTAATGTAAADILVDMNHPS